MADRNTAPDYQILTVPLTAGLKTKDDVRAMAAPGLSICSDGRFDEVGGIQTRFPFLPMPTAILGGFGNLTNVRRLAVNGDELLVFTDVGIYSWNAQLAQWMLRGTHLAVATDETPRFVTTGDQTVCDRAELNGTIVYTWTENLNTAQLSMFAAAIDKATGATLAVTQMPAGSGNSSVVALATKILLFNGTTGNNLVVRVIDPAAPAAGFASGGTNVASGTDAGAYDVVRIPGTDQCIGAYQRTTPTSYTLFTVTAGLTVATSTKARTANGPIAVAVTPDSLSVQVVRGNGGAIQGDLVTINGLTDVFVGQAIGGGGSPVNQIAAAFSSATFGGAFVCTVWWSFQETNGVGGSTGDTKMNTVTSNNVPGTQSTFVEAVGVASRAFEHNGSVFVWLVWAKDNGTVVAGTPIGIRGAVQNTYYLYRSDGFLVAQAAEDIAGGYLPIAGRLPGITVSGNAYTWCGTWRRTIQLGGQKVGNATRSPRDITATFDAPGGRRTARIGATLYIAGGLILQYDGVQIVEVGTLVFPWAIAAQDSGVAGNLSIGGYNWKGSVRWQNATGESERSTTATGVSLTLAASHLVFITTTMLFITRKLGSVHPPEIECWRTAVNTAANSPFFLITSNDPTQLLPIASNPFVPNDPQITAGSFVFNDNYSDATLITAEANPENAGGLEHLAPPPASIIIATDTRIFLAGVPGDPDAVWYSRERDEGEIASFNDQLRIPIPTLGGAITALAILNETLIVFRETAIYALAGVGFNNAGQGQNFGPASLLAGEVGALSHESVATVPLRHGLLFKSRKGWYMLGRDWVARYNGSDVAKFDGETVTSVEVVDSYHQIRCTTSGRILTWDYLTEEWSSWSISDAVDAVMWQGQYLYLSSGSNAVMAEQTSFPNGSVTYGLDVETGWIKPADQQGAARVDEYMVLGEYRGPCLVRLRTAFDYQYDGSGNPVYTDDTYWAPSPAVIGSILQVRRGVSRGKCEALKIRITATSLARDGAPPASEAIKLTGIALKVRPRSTRHTRLSAAQKA